MSGPSLAGRRVAVVNWRDLDHSLAGGSERYAWEFALALRDVGARVDFVTAREQGQSAGEVLDGINVIRRGGVFGFYLAAAWYFLRHRRSLAAVVDPECGIPTFSPLFVRRRTPVVLVVHHVHQAQFRTYFPWYLAVVGRFLERRVMPRVYRDAAVVAVSDSTREEMVAQLGWTRPVGLLPNGNREPDWRCEAEQKEPQRVVVLGRLVPHKRVDMVVRAVHALAEEFSDLHLDIVGRGPEEQRLRDLVHASGLEHRVTIHGFVAEDEKEHLLRRASLHVCASDVEGWGQVVIEAAAHGVPTVARDVPGLRDSIREGQTGWLVPDQPGRLDLVEHALTTQMREALTDLAPVEVRRVAVKECLNWASRFSWSRMRRDAAALVLAERARLGA